MDKYNIKIDPIFRDAIYKPSEKEIEELEMLILKDGKITSPLIVWKRDNENRILIDGHNRYRIAEKYGLDFQIEEKEFNSADEALEYELTVQLARRNLTDEQREYLIGKQYKTRQKIQGTNNQYVQQKSESDQNEHFHSGKTADVMAKEYGIGQATVRRAGQYSEGLDNADKAQPGFKSSVLTGEIKASKKSIRGLKDKQGKELEDAITAIKEGSAKQANTKIPSIEEICAKYESKCIKDYLNDNDNIHTLEEFKNDIKFDVKSFKEIIVRDIDLYSDVLKTKEGFTAFCDAIKDVINFASNIKKEVKKRGK